MRINSGVECRIEEDAIDVEIRFQTFQAFSNIAANTRVEKEGKNYCTLLSLHREGVLFFSICATFCDL